MKKLTIMFAAAALAVCAFGVGTAGAVSWKNDGGLQQPSASWTS